MPYPTAANAGVPSGITLTPSGDIIVTRAGTVLNGLDIKGMVIIRADNVTVQNSRISSDEYAGVKVERGFKGASVINSDIDGMGSTAGSYGIMGNGTFVGNDIRGFENGINLTGGSSTIRGNYIHGLKAPGSPHYDGIQIQGGQNGVLIENNTIIVDHGPDGRDLHAELLRQRERRHRPQQLCRWRRLYDVLRRQQANRLHDDGCCLGEQLQRPRVLGL